MMTLEFTPFPVLETERFMLIQITQAHQDDLYELLSNPNVAEFDYFYPVESMEKVMKFIARYESERESQSEITWGILMKDSHELIGTCCLGNFDEDARRAEIGYALKESHWGKGVATEVVGKVTQYGFKTIGLNRIEATITPGNDASVRVLEKIGYQREGLVRERDFLKGQLVDGIIMGILAKDLSTCKLVNL